MWSDDAEWWSIPCSMSLKIRGTRKRLKCLPSTETVVEGVAGEL